jgi:hypothetical protein
MPEHTMWSKRIGPLPCPKYAPVYFRDPELLLTRKTSIKLCKNKT